MLYPAIAELVKHTENRYRLVILTAKRAREIFEEDLKGTRIDTVEKPVSQAVDEIYNNKITYIIKK